MYSDEDLQNEFLAMTAEIQAGEEKVWSSLTKLEQLQVAGVLRRCP